MTEEEIIERVREEVRTKQLPVPATREAIVEAEEAIGYQFPSLLRRLYLEVANGGFGPGDGILGVPGGDWRGDWADVIDVYRAFSSAPDNRVPAGLVWISDWGCAIWSLIDCRDSMGSMWGWNPDCGMDEALFECDMNFSDWISVSLDNRLAMPSRPND